MGPGYPGPPIQFNRGILESNGAASIVGNVCTLDLSITNVFYIASLTTNINSFTLNNIVSGTTTHTFTLFITQDSFGGRTVTWTFTGLTLKWPGGVAPTLTSTANKGDAYTFISFDGGSVWWGFVGGQNY